MARLYCNENFPLRVVNGLRRLGHDVLTSFEAGRANQKVPDDEVLAFACRENRAVLTLNRLDFFRLHRTTQGAHAGVSPVPAMTRIHQDLRNAFMPLFQQSKRSRGG